MSIRRTYVACYDYIEKYHSKLKLVLFKGGGSYRLHAMIDAFGLGLPRYLPIMEIRRDIPDSMNIFRTVQ